MSSILSWIEYAKNLDMISFLELYLGHFALNNFSKSLIDQSNTYVDKQKKRKSPVLNGRGIRYGSATWQKNRLVR